MEKLLFTLMLSSILFVSFAQDNTTKSNISQPAQQKIQMSDVSPQCQIGDLMEHKVTKVQILEQPYLKVVPEMNEPFKMEVTSFRVVFVTRGLEDPPILCQGNQLSEKVKDKIAKLPAGALMYIEDINAKSKACIRKLDEVSYKIVE